MAESFSDRVARRRVFYLPGFDPLPPRRYRELYRKEAARQAEISGYRIAVEGRRGGGQGFGWHVTADIEGATAEADFEVLNWSDLVKNSMSHGIAATYAQLARTAWIYIASGALRRLMWLRKGPIIAALYPIGMLIAQALAAAALAAGAGWLAGRFLHPLAGWVAAAALFVLLLRWFRSLDGRTYAYYLMHDYAFTAGLKGRNPPQLEARLAEFRHRISEALAEPVDEVLLVGHSSGAHLAINVVADMLRAGEVPGDGPALSLLTLGHVVPMLSFLPEAHRLRADLALLSTAEDITWVDVSAPGDGCSFALCDPVAVSGVAPASGQRWPLVLSAAFTQTLSPERWRRLRWRFFRLHFQYLCAFDRPGDYDYFRITAGPMTLAARFRGRKASKSRIDRPASPYRSVAA